MAQVCLGMLIGTDREKQEDGHRRRVQSSRFSIVIHISRQNATPPFTVQIPGFCSSARCGENVRKNYHRLARSAQLTWKGHKALTFPRHVREPYPKTILYLFSIFVFSSSSIHRSGLNTSASSPKTSGSRWTYIRIRL